MQSLGDNAQISQNMCISQYNVFWLHRKSLYLPKAKFKISNETMYRKRDPSENRCKSVSGITGVKTGYHNITLNVSHFKLCVLVRICFLRAFYILGKQRLIFYSEPSKSWESEENLGKVSNRIEIWPHTKQLLTTMFILQSTGRNVLSISYPNMIIYYWYINLLLFLATFQEIGWEFWIDYNTSFTHLT